MNGISDEFQKPIRPIDAEEQDHLRVTPSEKDKKMKERGTRFQNFEQKGGKFLLLTPLLFLLKKVLTLTGNTKEEKLQLAIQIDALGESILRMKETLDLLKNEDLSNNAKYSQRFSELWHLMNKQYEHIQLSKELSAINLNPLGKFLDSVNNYPPNTEHSLGYYLSEYAGKDWLPLPFIEILKKIHTDYIINKADSYLERWDVFLTESLKL